MDYPDFYAKGPTPCSATDPDAFFPDVEVPGSIEQSHQAKKVCKDGCPYIQECLDWAISNNEPGVWGGTSVLERQRIRRERNEVRLGLRVAQ